MISHFLGRTPTTPRHKETQPNFHDLEEQGLGHFDEDFQWVWTLLPDQILREIDIQEHEEAEHDQT